MQGLAIPGLTAGKAERDESDEDDEGAGEPEAVDAFYEGGGREDGFSLAAEAKSPPIVHTCPACHFKARTRTKFCVECGIKLIYLGSDQPGSPPPNAKGARPGRGKTWII
jgi:hypothetical protein